MQRHWCAVYLLTDHAFYLLSLFMYNICHPTPFLAKSEENELMLLNENPTWRKIAFEVQGSPKIICLINFCFQIFLKPGKTVTRRTLPHGYSEDTVFSPELQQNQRAQEMQNGYTGMHSCMYKIQNACAAD